MISGGQDTLTLYQPFSPVAAAAPVGQPRIVEIVPGAHGIAIEPWRANLLWNPSAATNLNYIVAYGSGATVTRDSAVGLTYGTAVRADCDGTSANQGAAWTVGDAPQGSGTYVGTVWVWSQSGGEQLSIGIGWSSSIGAMPGQAYTSYTLVAGWQRLLAPVLTIPQSAVAVGLQVNVFTTAQANVTWWGTDAQLECGSLNTGTANGAASLPTSFIDGSSTEGQIRRMYSWDSSNSLVSNGSFDSGMTGWTSENGSTAYQQTSGGYIGANCAALTGSGDFYQYANAAANQAYTVSWACSVTGTPATAPVVTVSFWSASAQIGSAITVTMPTTAGWNRGAITTGVSPGGTTRIRYQFGGPGATGTVLWDAIQAENKTYTTPYAATGVANNTSARRGSSRLYVPFPVTLGSGVAGAGRYVTVMGWSRLGYTPSASPSTGQNMFVSGNANYPIVGPYITQLSATIGSGGSNAAYITPTTPFSVGDLVLWALTLDYTQIRAANKAQLWCGHAGSLQSSGMFGAGSTLSSYSGIIVGNYTGETYISSYASRSPTAVWVFNALLSPSDIARYWNLGPAGVDPTQDPRIYAAIGYGGEQLSAGGWIAGTSINVSGGVYQPVATYTGTYATDDGAGNALPPNRRRFDIPITPDAPPVPLLAPMAPGPLYGGLITADNSSTDVDNWSVDSIKTMDPNQTQVFLTRL